MDARRVADSSPHSEGAVDVRVDEAIQWADAAIAIITRDKRGQYGAPNVVEEIGRWRGSRGKKNLCIVREESVRLHSNLQGIIVPPFKRRIKECFEDIRRFLAALEKTSDRAVVGTWINLVSCGPLTRRTNPRISIALKPAFIGITTIDWHQSALRYYGENYDLSLRPSGHFKTELAELRWPQLDFQYKTSMRPARDFWMGLGCLRFEEQNGRPSRHFVGECFDLTSRYHVIEGWRLSARDLTGLSNPSRRVSAIRRLALKNFPQLEQLL